MTGMQIAVALLSTLVVVLLAVVLLQNRLLIRLKADRQMDRLKKLFTIVESDIGTFARFYAQGKNLDMVKVPNAVLRQQLDALSDQMPTLRLPVARLWSTYEQLVVQAGKQPGEGDRTGSLKELAERTAEFKTQWEREVEALANKVSPMSRRNETGGQQRGGECFGPRRAFAPSPRAFGEHMTMPKDDWRRPGGEFLHGVPLVHRKYRHNQKNPKWDHDHCEFCGVTFSLMDTPEDLKEGYATEDDYRWVCPKCFEDFRDEFKWVVREEMT
jgi:hypothetical protein